MQLLIHLIANSSAAERVPVATPTGLNAKRAFFAGFFNESRRIKVPKPYSKESISSGTF